MEKAPKAKCMEKLQEGDKVKSERKVDKLEKQMTEQEIIQGETVNFEKIIEEQLNEGKITQKVIMRDS